MVNQDPNELAKFTTAAEDWWNPQGPMSLLHQLNPLRLAFIQQYSQLREHTILDVGCGGGILTESLAQCMPQSIAGIDLNEALIKVASSHAQRQGLTIDYQTLSIEELAHNQPQSFDVITCMELLEHVPDPAQMVSCCSQLLRTGGTIFFATINRTLKSFLHAIVGAEYILRLLPIGTHHYQRLIKPSELTHWAKNASLELKKMTGVHYNPLRKQFKLTDDTQVNFMACYTKRG